MSEKVNGNIEEIDEINGTIDSVKNINGQIEGTKAIRATIANSRTYPVPAMLTDLQDTDINDPEENQVLKYDGEKWVNANGGGSGGTSDYSDLINKPSINDVELSGNLTSDDLGLANADDIPTNISELSDDTTHRTVTDDEKATWNGKVDPSTTLAGYGITDSYTKTEIDEMIGDVEALLAAL